MSLRNASSINVVRLNSSLAPGGTATFNVSYIAYGPNGAPVEADPVKVQATVFRPDGATLVGTHPAEPTDSPEVVVSQLWRGHYAVQVYLGDIVGRWRMRITTNDGYGPTGEVEFQVVPAT